MKISDRTRDLLERLEESMIQDLDLDRELIRDCFPLQKPYRKQAGEALLTVETRMRDKLKLPHSHVGIEIIDDAKRLEVFKRDDPAEAQGVELLFRGSVLGLRNILHHTKVKMDKEEATKVILFADYLLKLFERLCKENKIKP